MLFGEVVYYHEDARRCAAGIRALTNLGAPLKVLLFIFGCLVLPAIVLAAPVDALVHAELKADESEIAAGQVFHVGVFLKIEPGWHIYWKNPGDSGLATKVTLQLPAGFTSAPVEYPYPTRMVLPGDIANYAYENETMLIIPVTAPKDLVAGSSVSISAKVNWLVCKETCLLGGATVNLTLPIAGLGSPANTELFQQWMEHIPVERDPDHVADVSEQTNLAQGANGLAGTGKISIRWKTEATDIQWFPDPANDVILSDIKISIEKSSTVFSYHVDVPSDPGNFWGIESIVEYTTPGGRRMALAIPGRAK